MYRVASSAICSTMRLRYVVERWAVPSNKTRALRRSRTPEASMSRTWGSRRVEFEGDADLVVGTTASQMQRGTDFRCSGLSSVVRFVSSSSRMSTTAAISAYRDAV